MNILKSLVFFMLLAPSFVDAESIRTNESISKTIDGYSSLLDNLYQESLKKQPEAKGKIVLKIIIEPSGVISDLSLVKSELNLPELEEKVIELLRGINFGEAEVSKRDLYYTIKFFPN